MLPGAPCYNGCKRRHQVAWPSPELQIRSLTLQLLLRGEVCRMAVLGLKVCDSAARAFALGEIGAGLRLGRTWRIR